MNLDEVAERFQNCRRNGKGYKAVCPVHDDSRPSVDIDPADNGGVLVICRVGCATADVLAGVGLTMADLAPANGKPMNGKPAKKTTNKKIAATYDYRDENNVLLYQSVRYEPKDFLQRSPKPGGGWNWSTKDVPKVLYRLPELLAADPAETVFVCEGEKDVDRLRSLGLVATCNVGGASKSKEKSKWLPEYSESLRGRHIVILVDNDEAGDAHSRSVAMYCYGTTASEKLLYLPDLPPKGDVSDWLDVGGTKEELLRLVEMAAEYKPGAREPGDEDDHHFADPNEAPYEDGFQQPAMNGKAKGTATASRYEEEDIGPPLTLGEMKIKYPKLPEPIIHGLLRRGETMNIIAASKVGKSWLIYEIALCVATGKRLWNTFGVAPGDVLILDNELPPEVFTDRVPRVANALGIPPEEFDGKVTAKCLRGHLLDIHGIARWLRRHVKPGQYRLVVIDAYYRILPDGMDENSNNQTTQVYNQIDSLSRELGCAFALVHHSSKGSQSERAVTDVGAGAGAQSRAADAHLVLRPHEEDGVVVLEAALRSWAPVEPMCLKWSFPLWTPVDGLDTTALKTSQRKAATVEQLAERVFASLRDGGPDSQTGVAAKASMSGKSARTAILQLLGEERIERCTVIKNNQEQPAYRVVKDKPDNPDGPDKRPDNPVDSPPGQTP